MVRDVNIYYYLKKPTLLFIILTLLLVVLLKLFDITTVDTLITLMSFISFAASLNIIMGFAGYVDFGHAVFIGISGYTYVLAVWYYSPLNALQHMGWGLGAFTLAVIAGLVSALIAGLVGFAVLKLRGAYFAIATLGLSFAALYIIKSTVPALEPTQFYAAEVILPYHAIIPKMYVFNAMLIATAFVLIVNYVIRNSKFGVGLLAIKEDEDAAEDIGVPTVKYKILAYLLSAFFAGLVGALISLNRGGVDETAFSLAHSIDMIVMLVIGGLGSVFGTMLGAYIYYWLYDTLLVKFPGINLIILGIIVMLIVLFAPDGIVGLFKEYKIAGKRLRELLE